MMNRQNTFNRLQFDNHFIFDQEIKAITTINYFAVINQWQHNLLCYFQALLFQLMSQAGFIG